MSKTRLGNLQTLHTLTSTIKDEDIKDNVERVLYGYENKYISQFTTAKNLIKSFTSKDEKKINKATETYKHHTEKDQ
jgi:ribosomal protein S17E